jgi:hypothetical protein
MRTRIATLASGTLVAAMAIGVIAKPVLAAGPAWTWTIAGSPNPTPEQTAFYQNELLGVTCQGPTECWAVGNTGTSQISPLIEHYDGAAWQSVASPAVPGNLWGVTCVSVENCWAVGREDDPTLGTYVTLIEHFDGASWTVAPSPNVTQAQFNSLNSVACTSTACFAAGYYGIFIPNSPVGVTVDQTLVEQYDPVSNSWSIASTPDTSPVLNNQLAGISCAAAGDCWATGVATTAGGTTQTLTEHWDGTSWAIVSSPNPGPSNNYLTSVRCLSQSACWASGGNDNGTTQQALVEHYDGSAWTVSSVPSSSPRAPNVLTSVDCSGIAQCAAVGYRADDLGSNLPLAEAFDGDAWTMASVESTPGNPGANNQIEDFLYGVTCISTAECWTVGYQFDWRGGSGGFETLVEHGVAGVAPPKGVPEVPWVPLLLVAGTIACGCSVRAVRRDGCRLSAGRR